ncbi:hypothetical protein GM3708_2459 [Geminocystis sp. NIES-3708]|nr:hypothetical protein GM3708_2459 [Geminocystis sp. NIES-3708]
MKVIKTLPMLPTLTKKPFQQPLIYSYLQTGEIKNGVSFVIVNY